MALLKGYTDEIRELNSEPSLGISAGEVLSYSISKMAKQALIPFRLFASSPADSVLNIGSNKVEVADGATLASVPYSSTLPNWSDTTINFQTGAVSGGTVKTDGGTFTLPTTTVGQYRRCVFVYRASINTIDTSFSAAVSNIGDLVDPGTLTALFPGTLPIGYIDLEATASTAYKTAGSTTSIIENKVGSTSRIIRFSDRFVSSSFVSRTDGFEDPANVDVSYNYTARTVTLTHASGYIKIYHQGDLYTLTSPWTSSAHTNATGNYYLSMGTGGTISWDTTFWDLLTKTPMTYCYFHSTSGYYIGFRECHGLMDGETHLELHEKIGTYRRSGGSLTAGTYAIQSATDADITPGTDQVIIADEDLPTTNAAWTQGSYTRLHFISNVAVFTQSSTMPFPVSGGNIQYNPSGTSLSAITTNSTYVNVYVIYMPVASDSESQKYRTLWLIGQTTYTSLAAAQAEDFRSLNLGDLADLASEFIPFVQITYRRENSYGSTGKVRIEASPLYITGSRSSLVTLSGLTPSNHSNLSGRSDPSSHPASAIDVSAFVDRAATDLQTLLDTYPRFVDYIETVSGSPKTTFTLTGIPLDSGLAVDVEIDGRGQPIEGVQWTRVNANPGQITMATAVNVDSIFKCRVHKR